MTEERQLTTVTQLPTGRSLEELFGQLATGVDKSDVAALILEDFRRTEKPLELSQHPTELEVRIAVAFDVYMALTQGNGNLSKVPQWLGVSGRKILEDPFKADYLRTVDSLLRQRTSDGVGGARKILDIIGWPDDYRAKVIFALRDMLLASRHIDSAKYAVSTLREMDAETELQSVEREVIKRLASLPYDSKASAAVILRVLGKDKNEEGEPRDELRFLVEEIYARFPRHPYEVLHNMQKIGLSPDQERLLALVKDYTANGRLDKARSMALALKNHNIGEDSLIIDINRLIEAEERRERRRYNTIGAAVLGVVVAGGAVIVNLGQNTRMTQQVRSNYQTSISIEYERAKNWMTVYRRSIIEVEAPNDSFLYIRPHEIFAINDEWLSKGKEHALASIRAKIEGSIKNLTEYVGIIDQAPLPEAHKSALRNIAWTYVKELQKGLEGTGTKR